MRFARLINWDLLFTTLVLVSFSRAATLEIGTEPGNASSPLLYGLLFEDVYHSGDGGLYGELIQNRAFQGTTVNETNGQFTTPFENVDYYHPIGNVTLNLDSDSPTLSSALPYQMRVDIPQGSSGQVGFYNEGFWGFNVTESQEYTASFYLLGTYNGSITCSYVSNHTGSILGNTTFSINQASSDGWKQYSGVFVPTASCPDAASTFQLTFEGSDVAGQSLRFQMISSFPQTYKDHGMRLDLAESVAALNGKYLRFPGGNNLEGFAAPYHLRWNDTIGPLVDRPLYPGTWGYVNTNGFGLLEQIQWTIDMDLTPILAVWSGLYLDGTIISQDELQPYIDDALNELEFFLVSVFLYPSCSTNNDCRLHGPSTSQYGALRASLGFPDPINITYVEIGNEDNLNGGTDSYTSYRFRMFSEAILAAYPHIHIVSSIWVGSFSTPPSPGTIQDLHDYLSVDQMVGKYGGYDHAPRDYPVLVGEYAAIYDQTHTPPNQLDNPTLQSATSEAIYFLGLERNSDVIVGISHGALIKSLHDEPDNVAFMKHSPTEVVHSYSYYVFKLFSNNYGSMTVPITSPDTPFGPLYWSGTRKNDTYYIKIVNFNGSASTPVSVTIPGKSNSAQLITLTGPDPSSTNLLGNLTSQWSETTVPGSDGTYNFALASSYISAVLVVE